MAKPDYDQQMARIAERKARAEKVERVKQALANARKNVSAKQYGMATAHARALVAALEALTGEGKAAAE